MKLQRQRNAPTRVPGDPSHALSLTTSDGVSIAASHDPGPAGDGREGAAEVAVVVAHGFTHRGTSEAVRRVVEAVRERAGVVTLDLRGHGASSGRSTIGDLEVHDVEAAVAWAREQGYARVATLGFSLGGAVVVRHAGTLGGVDAVAAVSAPASWYYRGTRPTRRLHRVLGWPVGPVLLERAYGTRVDPRHWDARHPETWCPDPTACARRVQAPMLVVHGDQDRWLPLEHAEALHAAAAGSELWVEPGYGHAEGAAGAELLDRVATWLVSAAGAGAGRLDREAQTEGASPCQG